jgi:hypothetical protein
MTIQNRADENNITKSGMTGKVARSKHHYCRQVLMAENKARFRKKPAPNKVMP